MYSFQIWDRNWLILFCKISFFAHREKKIVALFSCCIPWDIWKYCFSKVVYSCFCVYPSRVFYPTYVECKVGRWNFFLFSQHYTFCPMPPFLFIIVFLFFLAAPFTWAPFAVQWTKTVLKKLDLVIFWEVYDSESAFDVFRVEGLEKSPWFRIFVGLAIFLKRAHIFNFIW